MAEVVWSRRAIRQLEAIRAYIAKENPHAARRTFLRLVAASDSLAILPERGRPISSGRRELAHLLPYLIRYRARGNMVKILEVRHAARKPE
ncbi:MAG: type II toxin-antitoxin system RelE/ParE family toxin [Caulobacter sp.]|nr:type II toxin-antitoxin system RelE/ParE family toxin [Caulobacter sp.]